MYYDLEECAQSTTAGGDSRETARRLFLVLTRGKYVGYETLLNVTDKLLLVPLGAYVCISSSVRHFAAAILDATGGFKSWF